MHLRVMQCESASESAPRNDSKQGTKIYDDEKSRQRISFFLSTLWGGSFAGGNVTTGVKEYFVREMIGKQYAINAVKIHQPTVVFLVSRL